MRHLLTLLLLAPALAVAQVPPAAPAEARPAAGAPDNGTPPSAAPSAGLPDNGAPPSATPPAAQAEAPLPAPPPPPPLVAPWPRYGLRLDLGVPDGLVLAFVARPLPWLRASAGPAWNYIGWGLQGGVAVAPLRWAITPVLSVDYGHFFGADVSRFVKDSNSSTSSGNVDTIKPLLKNIGYDYVNAQLGVEFGSQRGFTFFLRGGLAYLWMKAHGTATSTSSGTGQTTRVSVTNPSIVATIPTVRLGFLYFF